MANRIQQEKNRGALVYLGAFFVLAGLLLALLPTVGVQSIDNRLIPFSSFNVYFGGAVDIDSYSFYFVPNVPLIIMLQLFALAFISAILGKNLPRQLFLGLILLLAGIIIEFLAPTLVGSINASIPSSGLVYAPGFYLSIAFEIGAFIIILIKYIESRIYWHRQKAVV